MTDTLCFVLDYVGEETEPLATNHFRVYYNSTPYGFDTAAGFSSPVCTLSHVAGCEAVRLRLESTEDTFTMDGRARREITYPFAWYDSLPCLTWNAVLYAQYANRITWQVTAPAGRVAYPTHGALYVRRYLLCAGYTVLLTPLYYYFVRMIALKFRKEEKEAADERLN